MRGSDDPGRGRLWSRLWQWPVAWLLLAACLVLPLAACERDPAAGPDVPLPTVLAVPTEAVTPAPTSPPASPAIPTFRPTRVATSTATSTATHNATITPSATPEPSPTPRPTAVFSAERAMAHVMALASEIGPRVAGEEGAELAADYIADQFDSYGYEVHRQLFEYTKFVDHGSKVELLPDGASMAGIPMHYSPAGEVEGKLIPAGIGRPEDMPDGGFDGGIALIRRGGGIGFRDKTLAAAEAGAGAVMIYNDRPAPLRGSLGELVPVPVLGLDGRTGQHLVEQASRGPVSVRVTVGAEIVKRVTTNVIAERPGLGVRVLLIGAHYDSVKDSPGGNDNASGMAVLLELARVLSTHVLPEDLTVYFVAFGAEEDGLHGSRYFVDRLDAQQRQAFVAMLNYDMIGVGDVLGVGGSTELTDLAIRFAQQQGWTARQLGVEIAHRSDHHSFITAGVPALVFHAPNDTHYHKETDTPDRIQPGHLAQFGRLGLAVVQRLVAE